jgi:hypothetical protein
MNIAEAHAFAMALALSAASGLGESYHVAPHGSDDNPGNAAAPFRSISKAAGLMRPGDECVVHPGTYRETVRPAASGTGPKPILFTAGEGGEVIVAGSEIVADWTLHTGRIFSANVDWPVDQVFVNGRMATPARHPNRGQNHYERSTFDVTVSGTQVSASNIAGSAWAEGCMWAISGPHYAWGSARIVAHTSDGIVLDSALPLSSKGKASAYVEGAMVALDAEGEWCQRNGRIYFMPPASSTPNAMTIEATRRGWAFDLSGLSHIRVTGFRVLAASVNMDRAEHCLVARCRFRWPGFRRDIRGGFNRDNGPNIESEGLGVVLGGRHNAIRDSVVAYCVGDGITVYGESNTVENCVVHDCDSSGSDCAPVAATGTGHSIARCTIYNAGRSGLLHRKLKDARIEHNHIHHVGLMTSDFGGTYTYWTDGGGTVIAHNRIHDARGPGYGGSGIYIDNGSANFVIHHNLCFSNQLAGIHLNTPIANTRVINNTSVGGTIAIVMGGSGHVKPPDLIVANNILAGTVALKDGTRKQNNFAGREPGFMDEEQNDFRLMTKSPCIDAGIPVDGITDHHLGTAPDLGCFESGAAAWTAGSTLPKELWDEAGW